MDGGCGALVWFASQGRGASRWHLVRCSRAKSAGASCVLNTRHSYLCQVLSFGDGLVDLFGEISVCFQATFGHDGRRYVMCRGQRRGDGWKVDVREAAATNEQRQSSLFQTPRCLSSSPQLAPADLRRHQRTVPFTSPYTPPQPCPSQQRLRECHCCIHALCIQQC
jgi:hypothetical protein